MTLSELRFCLRHFAGDEFLIALIQESIRDRLSPAFLEMCLGYSDVSLEEFRANLAPIPPIPEPEPIPEPISEPIPEPIPEAIPESDPEYWSSKGPIF